MVSFYIRDKSKSTTGVMCAIQITGMSRIVFPVQNMRISTNSWGIGRMQTGKGRQENGRLQDRLNKIRADFSS